MSKDKKPAAASAAESNGKVNRVQFTNSRGRVVTCRAIYLQGAQELTGMIRERYLQEGKPIEPPTREVQTLEGKGVTEIHEYDESSLETDAERALWDAHIEAKREFETELSTVTVRYMFLEGIEIEPGAVTQAWVNRMNFIGFKLPAFEDAPDLVTYEYIKREFTPTQSDIETAIESITRASLAGVKQEVIEATVNLFRNSMEDEKARSAVSGIEGDAPGGLQD